MSLTAAVERPVAIEQPSAPSRMPWRFWLAVAFSTLLLASAIKSESLWIDEGFSAWVACHRSLPDMLDSLRMGDSSDLEMLLYNVYLWLWVHVFGSSEYALRAANLPFVALLVAALALTSRFAFRRSYAWMAVAVAPFLWVYANEARAYFPMMACAGASTGALLVYTYGAQKYRRLASWLCLLFLAAAMLFHMLAGFLLPAFGVILLAEASQDWRRWLNDWWRPVACLAPGFLLVAGYYVWTMSRGEAYVYGAPSVRHLLSVIYDFAGFEGLGPNRNVLRQDADVQTLGPYRFTLAAGFTALAVVFLSRWSRRAKVLMTAWVFGLTAAILAGFLMNSLFLARHVAALVPLLLFTFIAHGGKYRLALLGAVWMLSDVRMRVLPEYAKDDYRGAAAYVITHNSGAQTIWAADQLAAAYYGLRVANPYNLHYFEFDYVAGLNRVDWPVRSTGLSGANWDPAQVAKVMSEARRANKPVLLALSKTDLYDVHGGWGPLLKGAIPDARFQSFAIYWLH